jgi:hypothetical protein
MTSKDSHHHGNLSCSFCGKGQREVKKLIAGPTVYICDGCIKLCNDILAEEGQPLGPGRRLRNWLHDAKWTWFLWRMGIPRGKERP